MIRLIENEMTKILKKKSLYITLAITLAFIIICNIMYQYNPESDLSYLDDNIKVYEEQLKELNANSLSDKREYADVETWLEATKLIKQYGGYTTWQGNIINERIVPIIEQIKLYEYHIQEDEQGELPTLKEKYETTLKRLQNNDWRAFALEEKQEIEKDLAEQKKVLPQIVDKTEIAQLENEIRNLELQKQVVDWRLEKNISYEDSYLNTALEIYEDGSNSLANSNEGKEDYSGKQQRYATLESVNIAKYDIEHESTAGKTSDARGILLDIFGQYEIFIIIMIVMLAGAMISDEFSKGTIKLLLIKPYKRTTILIAKLLTCFIMLFIIILLVIGMQFVVGGIVEGFDSYQTPAVVYNHNSNQIQELSIPLYLLLLTLSKLPIYILLMTLAFAISTLFNSTALSIAITLLGYMGSPFINLIGEQFKIGLLKFFVTPNWDLSQYLFGGLPSFEGLSLAFSIIINIAYFVIMLIPTFIVFKKRNIKNV